MGEPTKRNHLNYRQIFCEIFDNIDNHFEMRFQDYGKLNFLSLVSEDKRKQNQQNFPQEEFLSLLIAYPGRFDDLRLRNELRVFYGSEDFRNKNPFELLPIFSESSMSSCFPELNKLISLICTIPVSTASVERSFSALKRIKTYSRNSTGERRMSNLALLSIEAAFLNDIRKNDDFLEKTIKYFADKERRMDFMYK